MSGNNFLSRLFWGGMEEEETRIYSAEEIGMSRSSRRGEPEEEHQLGGFTIERAAEMIDNLPSDVSRESAVRIVRGTLAATGVEVSDLDRSTRARVPKLSSQIELARNRQREVQEKTEETVRYLEEELRKAREARDTIIAEEDKKISRASAALKEVRRVRAFFDFPKMEGEENTASTDKDTQLVEPLDPDRTQVRWRSRPLADIDRLTDGPTEGSSAYGAHHGVSDEQ